MTIRVLKKTKNYRLSIMGRSVVVNFHGRFSQLFPPISWEVTHPSDVLMIEEDAIRLVTGDYGSLRTLVARNIVRPVPAASLGINYA